MPSAKQEAPEPVVKTILRPAVHIVRRALHRLRRILSHFRPHRISNTLRWAATVLREIRARRKTDELTVGIDISCLWEPLTGVGWYLYRILEHLANEPHLRLRLYGPTTIVSPGLSRPVVALPEGTAIEHIRYRVPDDLSLPYGWVLDRLREMQPLLLAADGNDVLFAPNFLLPRRFLLCRGARVTTVHDLGFHRLPWAVSRATRRTLSNHLDNALLSAQEVITPSAAVRDELIESGRVQAKRVTAIHHGPGQIAQTAPGKLPPGIPAGFALYVGTLEPRKNLGILLSAWRRLHASRTARLPTLILAGRYGWKTERLRRAIERGQLEGWVRRLGYVSEAQLSALYRAALFVVLPSLYEGFGLPAVEAMSAETPLLCSDIPVLREVAQDAAMYVNPTDQQAWEQAITRLSSSAKERHDLTQQGRTRMTEFSWHKAAQQTLTIWNRAAKS